MALTLNAAAITRRLRAAGINNVTSSSRADGAAVHVHATSMVREARAGQARRAAAHLLQLGYDVARTGGQVTVTLPPTPEEEARAAEANAQAAAAAAELANPESDAGRALDAAIAGQPIPRPRPTDALIAEAAQLGPVIAAALQAGDAPAAQSAQARHVALRAEVERRAGNGDAVAVHDITQRHRRSLQEQLAQHRDAHPGAFAARRALRQQVADAITAESQALQALRTTPPSPGT